MSTKQSPIVKNWLKMCSIAVGVSCGCTLPFTQNLATSALMGLATIPGVGASIIVRSRQQQRQIDRQIVRGKLRLNQLQQRRSIAIDEIHVSQNECRSIESRVSHLHSLAANLTDRINRDRDRHQQLEQQLVSLAIYCQEQEIFSTKLDRKIQEQQAHIPEIDPNSDRLDLESPQLLLHELDSAINDRQQEQQSPIAEVERLEQIRSAQQPELMIQAQKLIETRSQLSATELELNNKQAQLDDLVTATIAKENEIQIRARELKTAQLELNSRRAELDNLELQIQSKSQQIRNTDLKSFEPQPPIISRSIDQFVGSQQWYDKFIDNPHLTILQHIEKHGTITEIEASSKLGNARSVRQFANKLEEYVRDLPFSIRVESSPKGNRYLKEDRN
jgi:septal ring factor EnvC (AmiA/AmiB activator)